MESVGECCCGRWQGARRGESVGEWVGVLRERVRKSEIGLNRWTSSSSLLLLLLLLLRRDLFTRRFFACLTALVGVSEGAVCVC